MDQIAVAVAPELAAAGMKVKTALCTIPEVKNRRNGALERHIAEVIARLDISELFTSPILREYKKFYTVLGDAAVNPAEHLLSIIQRTGKLPNINNVVDAYNIVSAETLLSIGVHNMDAIKGNIRFKTTDGTERYTPLLKSEQEKVSPGEYACMDDEKILCRMDIKQCDETKIQKGVTKFLVYVEGNAATSEKYIANALNAVCENIKNFCKGICTIQTL